MDKFCREQIQKVVEEDDTFGMKMYWRQILIERIDSNTRKGKELY